MNLPQALNSNSVDWITAKAANHAVINKTKLLHTLLLAEQLSETTNVAQENPGLEIPREGLEAALDEDHVHKICIKFVLNDDATEIRE
jgi:hypothetical protein